MMKTGIVIKSIGFEGPPPALKTWCHHMATVGHWVSDFQPKKWEINIRYTELK